MSGTEFQLAACQMLIKFASAAEGDVERLANMARAQVVVGQAARSLITRSQILDRRWDSYSQNELLEFIARAEKADVPDEAQRLGKALDLLETAWGVIANAHGGSFENAPDEWREAAERFRDDYHDLLRDR